MTIGDRVREIRKSKGLTLEQFGERIGVTKSTVSRLENDGVALTNQTATAICAIYNVREEWLRNGAGDMFRVMDAGDHLAELAGRVLGENGDDLIDRLCAMLADLTPDEKDFIYRIACRLVSESTEKGEE